MAVGADPAKAGRPLAAPRPTSLEAMLAAITTPAHLAGPLPLFVLGAINLALLDRGSAGNDLYNGVSQS